MLCNNYIPVATLLQPDWLVLSWYSRTRKIQPFILTLSLMFTQGAVILTLSLMFTQGAGYETSEYHSTQWDVCIVYYGGTSE